MMMSPVVIKAEILMGEVIRAEHHINGYYVLMIRRSDAAQPGNPYMTIRGFSRGGESVLDLGHYDLDVREAHISFESRMEGGR